MKVKELMEKLAEASPENEVFLGPYPLHEVSFECPGVATLQSDEMPVDDDSGAY